MQCRPRRRTSRTARWLPPARASCTPALLARIATGSSAAPSVLHNFKVCAQPPALLVDGWTKWLLLVDGWTKWLSAQPAIFSTPLARRAPVLSAACSVLLPLLYLQMLRRRAQPPARRRDLRPRHRRRHRRPRRRRPRRRRKLQRGSSAARTPPSAAAIWCTAQ